jgi:hypothetical protein
MTSGVADGGPDSGSDLGAFAVAVAGGVEVLLSSSLLLSLPQAAATSSIGTKSRASLCNITLLSGGRPL